MVGKKAVRTYGVKQVFRFVKGIQLNRRGVKFDFFRKRPILLDTCTACTELQSYRSTMHISLVTLPSPHY